MCVASCRSAVQYKGEDKVFKAEEISSMVLIKMKETAQAFMGADKEVRKAVITVPGELPAPTCLRLAAACCTSCSLARGRVG